MRGGGLRVVIIEEHQGERAAHVPLDVVGEHAQEDMGAHAAVDGPHGFLHTTSRSPGYSAGA